MSIATCLLVPGTGDDSLPERHGFGIGIAALNQTYTERPRPHCYDPAVDRSRRDSGMTEPMRKSQTVRRAVLLEAGVAAAAALTARRNRGLALAVAGAGIVAARAAFGRNSPFYGRVITHGSRARNRFALTFDDGPGPSTSAILDALRDARAHATFFVLGRQVEEHPDLVARIVREGHELASHGYDHGILVFRGADHVHEQLLSTETAVEAIAGSGALSRFFRAPHGFRGPTTSRAAAHLGYRTVGWGTGVFDSAQPGTEVIADRVVQAVRPGEIILLHDADGWDPSASRHQTAEAIPAICSRSRALGLEPALLSAVIGP